MIIRRIALVLILAALAVLPASLAVASDCAVC